MDIKNEIKRVRRTKANNALNVKALLHKEVDENKGFFFSTLKFKLIASFLVPIAFIIILGIVSFLRASEAIQSNYEKATIDAINMASQYMRIGFQTVESTATQFVNDETIKKYLQNRDDYSEDMSTKNNIYDSLKTKVNTDEFIENIYLISRNSNASISTTPIFKDNGIVIGFVKTELGQYQASHKYDNLWDSEDDFLDKNLRTDQTNYSMRLIRGVVGGDGLIVIDIKASTINNILANLKFDKSGYIGLIMSDGREIIDYSLKQADTKMDVESLKLENIFVDEPFYQEALRSDINTGSKNVMYKGSSYLFMYSKVGTADAILCALMPKSTITQQADNIKNITIIIVIVACIVAILCAVILTNRIDHTINGIIGKLKLASKGDLTVQFESKYKDEFRILIMEIQTTFNNMKSLIKKVNEQSAEVTVSSNEISDSSKLFLKAAENISLAMNEIEQGINQQAKDAEECLDQMGSLSQRIELVNDNTKEIGRIADDTKKSVTEGTIISSELNKQTKSTILITTEIISNIERLAEKSSSIDEIINVINDIANQTNLLSLNASIEAARAGEYGVSFAVVASEIRKLAERSKDSVSDIKKIISSIQKDTANAVNTARKAEVVLAYQNNAVENTTEAYNNINENVEKFLEFLQHITENVANMEETRVTTLGSIENISAVLEEIAASANNINQAAVEQVTSIDSFNKSALYLNVNAKNLVGEIHKFLI